MQPGDYIEYKSHNATSADAIHAMHIAILEGIKDKRNWKLNEQFKEAARRGELESVLMDFVVDQVEYEPDTNNHQKVKTAQRTIEDGKGNCVDMAIIFCTFLTLNQVPNWMRQASIIDPNHWDHILTVTNSNTLDAVPYKGNRGLNNSAPMYKYQDYKIL